MKNNNENEFKVVRILDEYSIIINAGTKNGITTHDRFNITGVVDEVHDPDTNELLGILLGNKATVKPVQIDEKISICKNEITMQTENSLAKMLISMSKLNESSIKLPVDKSQISNPKTYSKIQIGDIAVLVKHYPASENLEKKDNLLITETK